MRGINIDSFLEGVEASSPLTAAASYDWARIVAEGKAARAAADGGRWRIGHLALLVERRYRSRALQRFAEEIGESYPTVRRYRWVVKRYDPGIRFRFPGLSFSHFQAVAGLSGRARWLERAERNGWSVDRLTRESRGAGPRAAPAVERARSSFDQVSRAIAELSRLDDRALARAGEEWLGEALAGVSAQLQWLERRLRAARRTGRSPARAAGVRR